MYRNPVGHTFMKPDATHGVVCRRGVSLQQVASTKEWSEEVCAKAREGEQAINSTFIDKSYFRKWKEYLSQMHHANPATSTGEKCRVLSCHWANFGWGRLPNGQRKFHPHEVWLYTCKGNSMEEWYKETPVVIVFAKNWKRDGSKPNRWLPIVPWIAAKGIAFKPPTHPDFEACDAPLPMEIAKQQDLRKLSTYLRGMTQAEVDSLHPEPVQEDLSDESGSESDSSDGD